MKSELWIEEKFEDYYGMRFKVEKTLFSGQSDFQHVDVVETKGHGRMLLNDGLVMLTERDEFVYHDMITHVPMFTHPNPKSVLIIGGGDGGTAREVLRHPGVEKCTMVEIDPVVVEACRKFLPQTACELDNEKLNLIIGDGVTFMAETPERFDIILIDSTDPIGPAAPLFGPTFYGNVKKCLNPDGMAVSQGESPFYHADVQVAMLKVLNDTFENVYSYNYSNLAYPGGTWSFTLVSKGPCPLRDFDAKRVEASELDFKYYNSEIHRGAFALPSFMRKKLKGLIKNA